MKYYGFNPFIKVFKDNKKKIGVIYDLLEASIINIPIELVELFDEKLYLGFDQLKKKGMKIGIKEKELGLILKEGIQKGLIVELDYSYVRKEILPVFEYRAKEQDIPTFFLRKIILQPTSFCDNNCTFCNEFLNCVCFNFKKEWTKEEIKKIYVDLLRYKGKIGTIELYGGNPIIYDNFYKLIQYLYILKPINIKVFIPFYYKNYNSLKLINEKILFFKSTFKSKIEFVLMILPSKDNYMFFYNFSLNLKVKFYEKIIMLLSSKEDEELLKFNNPDNNFNATKKYLLKKDLSNIDWYRKKIRKDFLDTNINFFEFYTRKYFHRCWGASFSIDSSGNVKPCLWSSIIYGNFKETKISKIMENLNKPGTIFFESLNDIEGCKDCMYRFGCKDCRTISEFISKKRKIKNPLCDL